MLSNHVSCDYVVTSVTFYHSAVVDLSRAGTVHSVEHDPCCPDPTKLSASDCNAVHFGLCSPLLKLPAFSIPPATSSSPPSPLTPKSTTTSTPGSPITPKGGPPIAEWLVTTGAKSTTTSTPGSPVKSGPPNLAELLGTTGPKTPPSSLGSPIVQRSPSPVLCPVVKDMNTVPGPVSKTQGSKMEIEMLDPVTLLASNLEDQLEALVNTFVAQDKVRLAARKKAETANGAVKTSPSGNKPLSTIKKYDKKIKDDRSSGDESTSSLSGDAPQSTQRSGAITHAASHQVMKDPIMQTLSAFSAQFGDGLHDGPAFKSSTQPCLRPSPEYQQTGVKAQITKFASKERDALQKSPTNSLERRHAPKLHPAVQETLAAASGQSKGTRSLDAALHELLKTAASAQPIPQPIPQPVYQNLPITTDPIAQKFSVPPPPYSIPVIQTYSDNNLVPFYANELQPEPSLGNKLFGSPPDKSYQSPQDFVQSAVDYAKNRIQTVQQGPKEEVKPKLVKNGHLVSDAKTKWESLPHQNWHEGTPVQSPELDSSDIESLQRGGGHKRTLSMEGLLEVPSPSIPHPKLTNAQKQHIKERSLSPTDRHVPIRPFLTKGSVAERVLLFERCPDIALERNSSVNKSKPNLISTWRPGSTDVQHKTQAGRGEACPPKAGGVSARRVLRLPGQREEIPRFHFPDGKPRPPHDVDAHLKKVAAVFSGLNEARADREEFAIVTKACGLPLYWKLPLFEAARHEKKTAVTCEQFLDFWRKVVTTCHDEASKFVYILSRGKRNYLVSYDFFPMMQDVIESHPGLTFLKEATEFHSRYIHTVIARIFYCVNRSWSGKITAPELRKSNFLQVLATLEEEEDINQITDYFSYEHFYVIYCKFWELDKDHDLYIDQNDLKLHGGTALSTKIIERIFSGAVTRGPKQKEGKMSYTEFVWFLISEEDKRHPRSIEYWFRCMDVDGDGFLSMYELEHFYRDQLQRLDALGIETLPFTDCLCQMLDIIKPKIPNKISLSDLKRCKMTPLFFDTFFNLEKYLDHEQRDPFASQREHDGEGPEISDWDRFAAEEYELLVAEEGGNEPQDELVFEDYDEEITSRLYKTSANKSSPKQMDTDDDDYDYAESDDYHY